MCFFFFKQKTAYEMRISDWSSDVCSSDLAADDRVRTAGDGMSLLLILAAVAAQPSGDEMDRFRQCAALEQKDASAGVEAAQAMQATGGDIPARQCLGLAYMAMDSAEHAAVVIEQAARAAAAVKDQRGPALWGWA